MRVIAVEISPDAERAGRVLGVIQDDPQETAFFLGDLIERLLTEEAQKKKCVTRDGAGSGRP